MRNLFLTTLWLLAFIKSNGQTDFEPAYVVPLDGDTIKGLIQFKRWDRSPLTISFKNGSGEISEYHPIDIKSFSVAGEIYETAVVSVDQSPYKIHELDESQLPEYVKDTVFLQSLISGDIGLMFLKDQLGKTHFYVKHEDQYQPLLYKKYIAKTKTAAKAIMENSGYKNTLLSYFQDCPAIKQKIGRLTYTLAGMTGAFEDYYECTSTQVKYAKSRPEGIMEAGLMLGAAFTELGFSGPVKYLSNVEYSTSTNPIVGLFFDIKILRSKGWRISNDIFYTSFNVKGQGYIEDVPDYTVNSSFEFASLKSHHALEVSLLKQGMIYISGGFSTGFVIQKECEIRVSYDVASPRTRPFDSQNYEIGVVAGVGFRKGKWNVEARLEETDGITKHHSGGSSLRRGTFFIRYTVLKSKDLKNKKGS